MRTSYLGIADCGALIWMKLVIFGLSISSAWGNGHATLWRGLCKAMAKLGHRIVFFEKDVPYYAANRDYWEIPGGHLILYERWEEIVNEAQMHLRDADAAMATSYCPDAIVATELMLQSNVPVRSFYDLDAPVTLARLRAGEPVEYLGPRGLQDFDLTLSYTGGPALRELRDRLGARRVEPLYGSVDPETHHPVQAQDRYRSDLSYLGTYATDRQKALQELFIDTAWALPQTKFLIGGSQYPETFPWTSNIYFVQHVPPAEHPAFYCSSRFTLNVTRGAMAEFGYCPSGRLFEAAACGVPIVTDLWDGLDLFFEPGQEILAARQSRDVVAALKLGEAERQRMARQARERTLACHTAAVRAQEMTEALQNARSRDFARTEA